MADYIQDAIHSSSHVGEPHPASTPGAARGQSTIGLTRARARKRAEKGELAADPEIDLIGIPQRGRNGALMENVATDAIMETLNSLPRARRRDPDSVAESVRQGVRSAIAQQWGKKPMCHVHVLAV